MAHYLYCIKRLSFSKFSYQTFWSQVQSRASATLKARSSSPTRTLKSKAIDTLPCKLFRATTLTLRKRPRAKMTMQRRLSRIGLATWANNQCYWSCTTISTRIQKRCLFHVSRHSSSSLTRGRLGTSDDLSMCPAVCSATIWISMELTSMRTRREQKTMFLHKYKIKCLSKPPASWLSSVHSTTFCWSTRMWDSSGLPRLSLLQFLWLEQSSNNEMV